MDDDEIVLAGEGDHPREEVILDHGPGGVVRVIDVHNARTAPDVRRNRREIGLKAELRHERHGHWLRAHEQRAVGVHGVPGIARQRDVARIQ